MIYQALWKNNGMYTRAVKTREHELHEHHVMKMIIVAFSDSDMQYMQAKQPGCLKRESEWIMISFF